MGRSPFMLTFKSLPLSSAYRTFPVEDKDGDHPPAPKNQRKGSKILVQGLVWPQLLF